MIVMHLNASRNEARRRRWSDPGPVAPDEADRAAFFAEDSEPWLWLRDRVAALEPMKDVRTAAQECQVAVARLTNHAAAGGPIADEVLRRLQSLTLDLHHESRRLQGRPVPNPSVSRIGVREWLEAPVDSGEPYGRDLGTLRVRHRFNSTLHVVGAAITVLLVASGKTATALFVYVAAAFATLVLRYLSNAEAGSTMRARFFSCLSGHTSDVAVALALAGWAWRSDPHARGWAVLPLVGALCMMAGIIVRVGALQGGAYVPRPRIEALVRLLALSVGLVAVSLRLPTGFVVVTGILAAYFGHEAHRSFSSVWNAGTTETAWTAMTEEGFMSHVFTAPHPNGESPGDVQLPRGRHPTGWRPIADD